MSPRHPLTGLGVALITPFRPDHSIDYDALGSLVDSQIEGGTDFLVVLGTTAETPTLTPDERRDIRRFVAERNAGRLPLVAGCGGNCTHNVVEELKATDFSGYSAILSVAPYYNKPSQEGLFGHFKAVAEASPLPIILYNVPGRTGVNMKPETTLRLARECSNILGIKEASGITGQAGAILRGRPDGFMLWSGDDVLTLPWTALGADGVISVAANAFPAEFAKMTDKALEGDFASARTLHHRFARFMSLIFADGNPSGIKCALHGLGRCHDILRLPLTPVGDKVRAEMAETLQDLRQQ